MHNETMSSRQRVVRLLHRQPVDRLPIDLGSHPSTGISAFAYRDLRRALGLPVERVEVYDLYQFLARVETDVLERFHCDLIYLEPPWLSPRDFNPRGDYVFRVPSTFTPVLEPSGDWVYRSGEGKMQMSEGGYFFNGGVSDRWDTASEDEALALNAKAAERIYKETPYAINYTACPRGPSIGGFYGGSVESIVEMLINTQEQLDGLEAWVKWAIPMFDKISKALGKYVQLISIGGDMGMQSGPFLRASWFEQYYVPFAKRVCDHIHQTSDIKVFLHSCGSMKELIPGCIEAGIDVLNPVQISAANMDPRELKAEFGDRIIFWGGGCNTQHVLGVATPQAVAANVRELVRTFKPGGGFVFNQVHNIMGNVPPQNIIAMLDTAYEESFFYQGLSQETRE
jgi:uroporphyrinogen decarboxylase